jgi:hypothetical protein
LDYNRKVQKHCKKLTYKFGIKEVPTLVSDTLTIDEQRGTDLWHKATKKKEMQNVHAAFNIQDDSKKPVGYKEISCHLLFDVKLDTLAQKVRFVAGGQWKNPPKDLTSTSVGVLCDSMRIFFLLVIGLNDVNVLACDEQNVYINGATKKKVLFCLGINMGPQG